MLGKRLGSTSNEQRLTLLQKQAAWARNVGLWCYAEGRIGRAANGTPCQMTPGRIKARYQVLRGWPLPPKIGRIIDPRILSRSGFVGKIDLDQSR